MESFGRCFLPLRGDVHRAGKWCHHSGFLPLDFRLDFLAVNCRHCSGRDTTGSYCLMLLAPVPEDHNTFSSLL